MAYLNVNSKDLKEFFRLSPKSRVIVIIMPTKMKKSVQYTLNKKGGLSREIIPNIHVWIFGLPPTIIVMMKRLLFAFEPQVHMYGQFN